MKPNLFTFYYRSSLCSKNCVHPLNEQLTR
jgi:hypothetical protein